MVHQWVGLAPIYREGTRGAHALRPEGFYLRVRLGTSEPHADASGGLPEVRCRQTYGRISAETPLTYIEGFFGQNLTCELKYFSVGPFFSDGEGGYRGGDRRDPGIK